MILSGQQAEATALIKAWIDGGWKRQQVFRLFGFAGTGKTTLARMFGDEVYGRVVYGAFTGKAASVLRKKGCPGAQTIHSMIYTREDDNPETGEPIFGVNHASDACSAALIIIDEVSMVDETLGRDLLSLGRPVLVLGDPGQLPPVKGDGFFTAVEPDYLLTEIHRQALDNPIIRLSIDVREGKRLEFGSYDGLVNIIDQSQLDPEDVLKADIVLVGKNDTRKKYNKRIRELLGRKTDYPVATDPAGLPEERQDEGPAQRHALGRREAAESPWPQDGVRCQFC